MQLDRQGDTLVFTWKHTKVWVGVLFTAFSVLWMHGFTSKPPPNALGYAIGFLFGAAFIVVGISLMLPHTVTTVFDMRSRRVSCNTKILWGLVNRSYSYGFDEIDSVGVKEHRSSEGGASYGPILKLKNGTRRRLPVDNNAYFAVAPIVARISAETGLRHQDEA